MAVYIRLFIIKTILEHKLSDWHVQICVKHRIFEI